MRAKEVLWSQRGRRAKEACIQRGEGPKREPKSMNLKRETKKEGGLRGKEPKR